MFVRMAWISFGALPCREKSGWQLASRCCWNCTRPWHASELVSFLVGLRTYQYPGRVSYKNYVKIVILQDSYWNLLHPKTVETLRTNSSSKSYILLLYVHTMKNHSVKCTGYSRQFRCPQSVRHNADKYFDSLKRSCFEGLWMVAAGSFQTTVTNYETTRYPKKIAK